MKIVKCINSTIATINSAYLCNKKSILIPYTKKTLYFLKFLNTHKYIQSFNIVFYNNNIYINTILSYYNNKPVINVIKSISKPSQKVFISLKKLKNLTNNNKHKQYIISTSKGLLLGDDSLLLQCSGEIICTIW